MSVFHLVLDPGIQPHRGKLAVTADGENGTRAIGHATATASPDGLVVVLDDATLVANCHGNRARDPYAPTHSHVGDISSGATPFARPLVRTMAKGRVLVGLELTGFNSETGTELTLRPGSTPTPAIPPRPRVPALGE